MSSGEFVGADVGLLTPGRAGSRVEAATGDAAYLQALLDAEAALARAQCGAAPAAEAIKAAARAERFDLRQIAVRAAEGGNPVIPLVAVLREAVGAEHAEAVHRGATSQDIMDTATMLVTARVRELILADLERVGAALADVAARHRATPMAGRTLSQQAVPTTFGLKAAGWRSLVLDARDRLAGLSLPAQLGGAAGTLAALVPDAASTSSPFDLVVAFATQLGLDIPTLPWHVLRTPIADLGAALALTAGALGKFAADVVFLGRTEVGEVRSGAGGSSAMPHKANPVEATLIVAAARQVPALASVLFGALVAEDERPAGAWHAEWQTVREALRLAGTAAALAAQLAEGLEVRPERMRANLDLTGGLILSERVAAVLGRDAARELIDAAGREGISLREVLAKAGHAELCDPADYLGAAPELVDRALRRR